MLTFQFLDIVAAGHTPGALLCVGFEALGVGALGIAARKFHEFEIGLRGEIGQGTIATWTIAT